MRIDDRIVLENGALRVVLAPRSGARIVSLQGGGLEFLLQPYNLSDQLDPSELLIPGLAFQDGACSGMDECLPTVARSKAGVPGLEAPDHGDYWNIPWTIVERADPASVTVTADGTSRPLRFTKRLDLQSTFLRIEYSLENLGAAHVEYLYACHPLFAIDAGDRIVLPAEVTATRLEYSHRRRLGGKGDTVSWPIAQTEAGPIDVSVTLDPHADTGDMLYTEALTVGRCGLYRAAAQRGVVLKFDPASLPHLGLWLCYGGWPPDAGPRQVAVALEPTVAPRGSLEDAVRDGVAVVLSPHEIRSWSLEFHLEGLAGGISEETFAALVAG
ncbi:aldose epimerase [Granulicella sp. dw_53]|uniref:aldose epimerase n=1 Tax=Granulicella sp. dw_53 TaxID=2719792 RepID=UPI001C4A5506|nr:aldose epimerase [Granulicella sp. dw_53]